MQTQFVCCVSQQDRVAHAPGQAPGEGAVFRQVSSGMPSLLSLHVPFAIFTESGRKHRITVYSCLKFFASGVL